MTISEYNNCVDEFSDGVYRFILKNLRETEISHDIVQESFMKMWIKRKEINAAKGKSYLFTTAYHTLIDHLRKNSRNISIDNAEHIRDESYSSYNDLKEILNIAVEKLPEVQRSVLMLRDYEGYSYQEIGEITNLSESQVKVYIYRARLFLKKFIVSPEFVL
ncbi:MAG: RNA polymerase sigma factor [Bacteroidetes bacterium]|nr:RNA polymerase sigma factor [Bacteroidota bacterium]MBL6944565.1 RNA polymerase sigma factor [Bacteroidales bacterium]